jgi:hypothetical protein
MVSLLFHIPLHIIQFILVALEQYEKQLCTKNWLYNIAHILVLFKFKYILIIKNQWKHDYIQIYIKPNNINEYFYFYWLNSNT